MLRVHEEATATTRFAVHGVPVVPGPTTKVPVPVLLVPGTVVADTYVKGPAFGPVAELVMVIVPFFTVRSGVPTSPAG